MHKGSSYLEAGSDLKLNLLAVRDIRGQVRLPLAIVDPDQHCKERRTSFIKVELSCQVAFTINFKDN